MRKREHSSIRHEVLIVSSLPRMYTTLGRLQARLDVTDTDATAAVKSRWFGKIRAATRMIDEVTKKVFEPIKDTRYFDYTRAQSLLFDDCRALSITSVVDGLSQTMNSSAVIPLGGKSRTVGAFYGFRLDSYYGAILQINTSKDKAIAVTGVWGDHDDYASAWQDSGVTLGAAISSTSATSITTTTNTGSDLMGNVPALSPGMLIQIDSEWLRITAISGTTVTVARGQNGSTAATHSNSTAIYVYFPPYDIIDIATRLAAYLTKQDDTTYGQTIVTDMGVVIPAGMPKDIVQALEPHIYRRIV